MCIILLEYALFPPDPPVVTGLPPGNDRCRDIPTYFVPVEDPLILSVNVTADPCPAVDWRLDGRTLAEVVTSAGCNMSFYTTNSCSNFTGPDTGSYTFTITINNVSDCTAGRYTITLSNRAGTVTSDPVFVTPEGTSIPWCSRTGKISHDCLSVQCQCKRWRCRSRTCCACETA